MREDDLLHEVRCYLIDMDLGMDLRALYKVDKLTNEQEKVKPKKTLPC